MYRNKCETKDEIKIIWDERTISKEEKSLCLESKRNNYSNTNRWYGKVNIHATTVLNGFRSSAEYGNTVALCLFKAVKCRIGQCVKIFAQQMVGVSVSLLLISYSSFSSCYFIFIHLSPETSSKKVEKWGATTANNVKQFGSTEFFQF